MLGTDEGQNHAERRRQRQQHIAREAAVGSVHPDLPPDLEALANDMRKVVEDLGEVAAGLPLNRDRRDEEPHVEQRDAIGQFVHRVAQWQTEVLPVEGLLELGADRRTQFLADHSERGLEGVAGADGSRQQVQRFRELLFELLESRRAAVEQPGKRQRHADRRHRDRGERMPEEVHRNQRRQHPGTQAHHQHGAWRRPHPGLLDQPRQARTHPGLSDQAVEPRQRSLGPVHDQRRVREARVMPHLPQTPGELSALHRGRKPRRAKEDADHQAGYAEEDEHGRQHHRISMTPSNMVPGRLMPDALRRSHSFGRTPVARKRPSALPSCVTPTFSNA